MSVINYSCSVNLCENHSAFRGFEVLKICFHTRTAEHITGAKTFLGGGEGVWLNVLITKSKQFWYNLSTFWVYIAGPIPQSLLPHNINVLNGSLLIPV